MPAKLKLKFLEVESLRVPTRQCVIKMEFNFFSFALLFSIILPANATALRTREGITPTIHNCRRLEISSHKIEAVNPASDYRFEAFVDIVSGTWLVLLIITLIFFVFTISVFRLQFYSQLRCRIRCNILLYLVNQVSHF